MPAHLSPLRLRFRREETGHCSDAVLLPEGHTVTLDLGALEPP